MTVRLPRRRGASVEGNVSVIGSPRKVWRFQLAGDDKVWEIPLMGSLTISQARALYEVSKTLDITDEGKAIDSAASVIEELCPGLIDTVTSDQLVEIIAGWRAASGQVAGESQASSDR